MCVTGREHPSHSRIKGSAKGKSRPIFLTDLDLGNYESDNRLTAKCQYGDSAFKFSISWGQDDCFLGLRYTSYGRSKEFSDYEI